MLPSRGIVRSLPSGGARALQSTRLNSTLTGTRSFHNGRQPGFSLRQTGKLLSARPLSKSSQLAAPLALGGVGASRHLSLWGWGSSQKTAESTAEASAPSAPAADVASTTATTPAAQSPPITPFAEPVSGFNADSMTDIVSGQDILNMPEQLGYLSAIGLDYGYGPSSAMQWMLEHVHVWTGFGWGGSIIATAFLLRCIMTWPQIKGLKFGALMQDMRKDPRSKEAMAMLQQAVKDNDMEARQKGMYIQRALKKEYGVKWRNMGWSFMQIPFTFGLFRILNGMVHIPVPSLETSGFLWFTDLTARDPFFILPAIATGLMISSILVSSRWNPPESKKMLKPMMYGVGALGFFCTTFLSAAVNLMGVSIAAATLVFSSVINILPVRRALGLPTTLPEDAAKKATYAAPRAADDAPQGMRERLTSSLNDAKKGFSDQVSNYTGSYSGTEQEKAERKRRELLRKLEENRKDQEREEFEKKYKGGR